MHIGIIGLPQSGKSTLFSLLTGAEPSQHDTGGKVRVGIAQVSDPRMEYLVGLYKPRKISYAQLRLSELPPLVAPGAKASASPGGGVAASAEFLTAVRDVDALLQVVRAFESDTAPHPAGSIAPLRDLEQLQNELLLADWGLVETRLNRVMEAKKKGARSGFDPAEIPLLERCLAALEQELPLSTVDFSEDEQKLMRQYTLLTRTPLVIVVNVDESQFRAGAYPNQDQLESWSERRGVPLLVVCGQLEAEIGRLEPDERAVFLADLGLQETGVERLARTLYAHLGMISYFTVGEDEVKAWTIRRGSTAQEAAGKIHSDIARGFIRAEVVGYEDLHSLGSMAKVKEKGLWRLEGKGYIVQDGDIMNFRFNV